VKVGGMEVKDPLELKVLDAKYVWLTRLLAEKTLDNATF
jgi:hypothetical protein